MTFSILSIVRKTVQISGISIGTNLAPTSSVWVGLPGGDPAAFSPPNFIARTDTHRITVRPLDGRIIGVRLFNYPLGPSESTLGFPTVFWTQDRDTFYPLQDLVNVELENLTDTVLLADWCLEPIIVNAAIESDFLGLGYDLKQYVDPTSTKWVVLGLRDSELLNFELDIAQPAGGDVLVVPDASSGVVAGPRIENRTIRPSPNSLNPYINVFEVAFGFTKTSDDPFGFTPNTSYYAMVSLPWFDLANYRLTTEIINSGIAELQSLTLVSFPYSLSLDRPQYQNQVLGPSSALSLSGSADFLSQAGGAVMVVKYKTSATPPADDIPFISFRVSARQTRKASFSFTREAVAYSLP